MLFKRLFKAFVFGETAAYYRLFVYNVPCIDLLSILTHSLTHNNNVNCSHGKQTLTSVLLVIAFLQIVEILTCSRITFTVIFRQNIVFVYATLIMSTSKILVISSNYVDSLVETLHYITLHRNYLKSPMVKKTAKRLSDVSTGGKCQ